MIVTVKLLFFTPQRSKIFIFVSFYLCISRYGAFFRRRTFLKFVTMKSYLGVFLLFLVCLQASQVSHNSLTTFSSFFLNVIEVIKYCVISFVVIFIVMPYDRFELSLTSTFCHRFSEPELRDLLFS